MTQHLDAAIAAAARYSVFPVHVYRDRGGHGHKVPALTKDICARHKWGVVHDGVFKAGFYAASRDPEVLREMWRVAGDRAVAVGVATHASGLIVIDDDTAKGTDPVSTAFLERWSGVLNSTRVHRTMSGGRHYVFAERGTSLPPRKISSNIDVRSRGGYVVWPPSAGYTVEHDVDPIPLPRRLLADVVRLQAAYTSTGAGRAADFTSASDQDVLDRIRTGADFHDATLEITKRWAKAGLPIDDARALLAEAYLAAKPGTEASRWAKSVRDGERAMQGAYDRFVDRDEGQIGAALAAALAAESGGAAPLVPKLAGAASAARSEPVVPAPEVDTPAARFKATTIRADDQRRPRDFLLGTHLRRGMVSVTGAPGGVGKSSLLLREIASLVTGVAYTHDEVYYPQLRVAMLSEDPWTDEVEHRMAALVKALGIDWADHAQDFLFAEVTEDTTLFQVDAESGTVLPTEFYEELCQLQVDVVVLDPVGAVLGIDENDNTLVSQCMNWLVGMAREVGCAVELVHHSTKDARKYAHQEGIAGAVRGAGAITDRARSARYLAPMTKSEGDDLGVADVAAYVQVVVGKANNGRQGGGAWYRRDVVVNEAVRDAYHASVSDVVLEPVQLSRDAVDDTAKADAFAVMGGLSVLPESERRVSKNSKGGWIGSAIARQLGIDAGVGISDALRSPDQKRAMARLLRCIDTLENVGALVVMSDDEVKPLNNGRRAATYRAVEIAL